MFAKSTITLSALALFGSISAASAYDIPESLNDRYLPATVGQAAVKPAKFATFADPESLNDRYAPATVGQPAVRPLPRVAYEVPENRIGDKYPQLERTAQPRSIFVAMHRNGRKV
jgi:hypothetical protein